MSHNKSQEAFLSVAKSYKCTQFNESNYTTVFFNLFAAAEPLVYVDVAHGTPGPALASAGTMQNLGAHSCEKWCYDVIMLSHYAPNGLYLATVSAFNDNGRYSIMTFWIFFNTKNVIISKNVIVDK